MLRYPVVSYTFGSEYAFAIGGMRWIQNNGAMSSIKCHCTSYFSVGQKKRLNLLLARTIVEVECKLQSLQARMGQINDARPF